MRKGSWDALLESNRVVGLMNAQTTGGTFWHSTAFAIRLCPHPARRLALPRANFVTSGPLINHHRRLFKRVAVVAQTPAVPMRRTEQRSAP